MLKNKKSMELKMTGITIVIGALGTIPKKLIKGLDGLLSYPGHFLGRLINSTALANWAIINMRDILRDKQRVRVNHLPV